MDIFRAERLAQDRSMKRDWDKSFKLVGPMGEIECEWLDPHFGLFQMKGKDGFVMTKQIPGGVDVVMPTDVEEFLESLSVSASNREAGT